MILLLGNYEPDRQESMLRFCRTLATELQRHGEDACVLQPRVIFGKIAGRYGGNKWVGYVDKMLFFPFHLRKEIRRLQKEHSRVVVHICDHSNATYVGYVKGRAGVLVTCHDLLAVRGAMGEDTDCPASFTGRLLQRWILSGLKKADYLACVSGATRQDLLRLGGGKLAEKSSVIFNFQNHAYRPLSEEEIAERLKVVPLLSQRDPYLLHVGSNLKRKNRAGILRMAAKAGEAFSGKIVFAGEKPDGELLGLARELGLSERLVGVARPDNDLLEALYAGAYALVFPSRFEGFGWPVIEAQACGCPVLTSGSTSLPEVAGEGALIREIDDEAGFAEDLIKLGQPGVRAEIVAKGYRNLERFRTESIVEQYLNAYAKVKSPA